MPTDPAIVAQREAARAVVAFVCGHRIESVAMAGSSVMASDEAEIVHSVAVCLAGEDRQSAEDLIADAGEGWQAEEIIAEAEALADRLVSDYRLLIGSLAARLRQGQRMLGEHVEAFLTPSP